MTREEARHILDNLKPTNTKSSFDAYVVGKAITMAIEALEQEPCDDAVSREDALMCLTGMFELNKNYKPEELIALFSKRIKALPPVRPQEPKTGRWIEHPEIKTSTPKYLMFYECSECGDKQCFCKSDIYKKHFCNNCGAKMVEPQESEEV